MNSVFRLLNVGASETSFKILKTLVRSTRPDGSVLPVGSFFISHLIRSDFVSIFLSTSMCASLSRETISDFYLNKIQPPETILKFSRELMKENLNPFALNVALENSLRFQKENIALFLLKNAKESGMILRPHFFWPLLTLHGKKKDRAGMYECTFADVLITIETVISVVVSL